MRAIRFHGVGGVRLARIGKSALVRSGRSICVLDAKRYGTTASARVGTMALSSSGNLVEVDKGTSCVDLGSRAEGDLPVACSSVETGLACAKIERAKRTLALSPSSIDRGFVQQEGV